MGMGIDMWVKEIEDNGHDIRIMAGGLSARCLKCEAFLRVGEAFTRKCIESLEDSSEKPTNPKDAIGSDKLPLHLWPETASALGCLALLDGACKYGRSNFRAIGVRSSIYYDAARRHLGKWFEGETIDPDSGVHHLGHVLACIAILVDAEAAGVLTDDRMFKGGYTEQLKALEASVKTIKGKYSDRNPRHYTIADSEAQDA